MKLAIILQISQHDLELAKKTCRLIAELEPAFNEQWEFVFSMKYGTDIDNATAGMMSQKFKTRVMRGTRRDVGWPDGPNAQWCDTVLWAFKEKREGKADWDYIFTTEPDIVPLNPFWLQQLAEFIAEHQEIPVMGVRHEDHVNGNLIIRPEFPMENKMFGVGGSVAWDMFWAPIIIPNAIDCPLMKNLYKRVAISDEELFAPRVGTIKPCFVHGVKDGSGHDAVIRKFGLEVDRRRVGGV